jgi:hypothetical protein
VYLLVALAITLLALLFARDINRSAHGAIGPRRSENRSFGQMVNFLAAQENAFDSRLYYLLGHGDTLSRPVFAARLSQLAQELNGWRSQAELLRRPVLAHNVNDVVATLTEQRVDDYQNLLSSLAARLSLPWGPSPVGNQVVSQPASSLVVTVDQWDVARWSLSHEPGRVVLPELSMASAKYYVARGITALVNSPTLALIRGIGIAAVEVNPSPLPAPSGVLLMPPVTSFELGVSVENTGYVDQPVTLRVTLNPATGISQSQTMSARLGPLQSYAFVLRRFSTIASERATLTVSVSGAPAGNNLTKTRTYQLQMSPSGNG